MEESLAMCRMAAEDGAVAIVVSPHMFNDAYNVTREDILRGVALLQRRLQAENVRLTIRPGADVRVVPDLDGLLRQGLVMTLGNSGKYLLVELPQDVLPMGLSQLLFSIQLLGITPIISHPERILDVQEDPSVMIEFVEAGNMVQLTAASITGDLGDRPQKCAFALISGRLAHLVASDAHSIHGRPPGLSQAAARMQKLLPPEEVEDILFHRPLRILAGEYINLPEPRKPNTDRRKRLSWGWTVRSGRTC
ncbi:tyrosine protein phosphatase [Candidatus Poribacteria bacterium]|nr:tyrosine protein phosphatase [Candidatus Poribacteria bacterium]